MSEVKLEQITSLAKRRGFIYQGSELYGGLAGTWDYGPLGVLLKKNIANLWWKMFVESRDDMYAIDSAILMNNKVWEASGHVSGFTDPLVECSKCKSRLRADHIKNDTCPVCGSTNSFSEPRQFNMMFKTNVGALEDDKSIAYLRPETAQGIFVNFKNIIDNFYPDLPFGIAQIGKAFRNEISPRDFLFRSREFDMMEIEYFVEPDKWEEAFEMWRGLINAWIKALGLSESAVHELDVQEKDRAHYSKRTLDFEFDFPQGRSELLGLAYRSDFDLANHQKASGKNLEYRNKDDNKSFLPHVVEPSFGLDRAVFAVLCAAYSEDEQNGERRTFLKLPSSLAPVKAAISPLLKNKPELVSKAREVYIALKNMDSETTRPQNIYQGNVMWDDNGNIGKRYRRQDEIGTPVCITIDFQTLEDDTVTVRDRDSTNQTRVKISELVK